MTILESVKTGLGITGDYQDGILNLYIDEVKYYLIDAGVKPATVESPVAVGLIIRGVADLWNYGAGEGKLSEYFLQRAIQLKIKDSTTDDEETEKLAKLTVKSTAGSNAGYTKISVSGNGTGQLYYKLGTNVLPNYGDSLTDWTEWNGTDEIRAEDGEYIVVCESDSDNKAVAGGTTTASVNLGV